MQSASLQRTKCDPVRVASFDDYEQIAALQAENGLSTKPRDEWVGLWRNNPAHQQLPGWPIGWVLEGDDHRIVGCLENVPSLYRFEGRTLVAAFGRGWATNAPYGAWAIALLARQQQQANVDIFLATTASSRTTALLSGHGWSRVPVGEWDRSAFWVTNHRRSFEAYVATKAPKPVAAIAGSLLSPVLWAWDAVPRYSAPDRFGGEFRWCSGFDERFEQFWAEMKADNTAMLTAERSLETLRWHFGSLLEQNRIWILTACQGTRLLAYAVFERRKIESLALTKILLVDLQAHATMWHCVPSMISYALERCRREQIDVLENVGCWLEQGKAGEIHAPHRRNLDAWCYLYRVPNPELAHSLERPEAWYPTQYDADASL